MHVLTAPRLMLLATAMLSLGFAGCDGCNPNESGVFRVEIIYPENETSIPSSATFRARALLTDDVATANYKWTSSQNGDLGNMLTVVVAGLNPGEHEITFEAQAVDESGNNLGEPRSVTHSVTVEAPAAPQ